MAQFLLLPFSPQRREQSHSSVITLKGEGSHGRKGNQEWQGHAHLPLLPHCMAPGLSREGRVAAETHVRGKSGSTDNGVKDSREKVSSLK